MTDSSQTDTPEKPVKSSGVTRGRFLKMLGGAIAGGAAAAAGVEYYANTRKIFTLDLTRAIEESVSGFTSLTPEEINQYTKITTAWKNAGNEESNKIFRDALSELNKQNEALQAPVLAQLLYAAAQSHEVRLMADLLGYCPSAYQIEFVGGTAFGTSQEAGEAPVRIIELLKSGRNLGMNDQYDIVPWTVDQMQSLDAWLQKVKSRIDPATRIKNAIKAEASTIINR